MNDGKMMRWAVPALLTLTWGTASVQAHLTV
jgi:hypothetical protein